MSHYVKRTRVQDTSAAHELGGPSTVGRIRFSKSFRTKKLAEREMVAWLSTGDWSAEVIEGTSPRGILGYEADGSVTKERR